MTFVIGRTVHYVALVILVFASTLFAVRSEPCVVSRGHGVCIRGRGSFLPRERTSNIRSLYIVDSRLDSQTFNQLAGFTSLTALHVDNSSFTILPQASVSVILPKLNRLHISHSNLPEQLAYDILTRAPNIRRLSLEWNKLSRVDKRLFKTLKHLETIDISHNDVYEIEPGAFENLPSLQRVDVSHNALGRGFDIHVLPLPSGCAVCGSSSPMQRTCTEDRLRVCESSAAVDELWAMSKKGIAVRLESNPLCSHVNIDPMYTDNVQTNESDVVSVGGCLVYGQGRCFEHEQRRRFLEVTCRSVAQLRRHRNAPNFGGGTDASGGESLKDANAHSGKQNGDAYDRGWGPSEGWSPGRRKASSLEQRAWRNGGGIYNRPDANHLHGNPNGDSLSQGWGPLRRTSGSVGIPSDKHDGGAIHSSKASHAQNPGWGLLLRKSHRVQEQRVKNDNGATHSSETGNDQNPSWGPLLRKSRSEPEQRDKHGSATNSSEGSHAQNPGWDPPTVWGSSGGWGPLLRKSRSLQEQRDKHGSATHSSKAIHARNPGWGPLLKKSHRVQDQRDKNGATYSSETGNVQNPSGGLLLRKSRSEPEQRDKHWSATNNSEGSHAQNPGWGPPAGWGPSAGWGPLLRKSRSEPEQRDKHESATHNSKAIHARHPGWGPLLRMPRSLQEQQRDKPDGVAAHNSDAGQAHGNAPSGHTPNPAGGGPPGWGAPQPPPAGWAPPSQGWGGPPPQQGGDGGWGSPPPGWVPPQGWAGPPPPPGYGWGGWAPHWSPRYGPHWHGPPWWPQGGSGGGAAGDEGGREALDMEGAGAQYPTRTPVQSKPDDEVEQVTSPPPKGSEEQRRRGGAEPQSAEAGPAPGEGEGGDRLLAPAHVPAAAEGAGGGRGAARRALLGPLLGALGAVVLVAAAVAAVCVFRRRRLRRERQQRAKEVAEEGQELQPMKGDRQDPDGGPEADQFTELRLNPAPKTVAIRLQQQAVRHTWAGGADL